MNWKTATAEEIDAKIAEAKRIGRGVTVSPDWLAGQLARLSRVEAAAKTLSANLRSGVKIVAALAELDAALARQEESR